MPSPCTLGFHCSHEQLPRSALLRIATVAAEAGFAAAMCSDHLGKFGPYFTHRYNTPWGDAINLDDAGSDEVRRFFCDNALMWLRDYHFDGLRLDAVHALIDTSACHFLEQLSGEVDTLEAVIGRHLVLIAESDLN